MRFVFDTNVLVSALLLEHSVSRRAFDRALDHGKLVLSFAALRELNEVLSRRQFRKYVDEDDIHRFLASLVRQAMWVEVSAKITACRDPNDDKFLELAVSGLATHIVTGDQDLLAGARPVSGDKHPDASRLSRPAPASTPKVLSRVVPRRGRPSLLNDTVHRSRQAAVLAGTFKVLHILSNPALRHVINF